MGMAEVTLTLVDPELAEAARKVFEAPLPIEASVAPSAESGVLSEAFAGDAGLPQQEPSADNEGEAVIEGDVRPLPA